MQDQFKNLQNNKRQSSIYNNSTATTVSCADIDVRDAHQCEQVLAVLIMLRRDFHQAATVLLNVLLLACMVWYSMV